MNYRSILDDPKSLVSRAAQGLPYSFEESVLRILMLVDCGGLLRHALHRRLIQRDAGGHRHVERSGFAAGRNLRGRGAGLPQGRGDAVLFRTHN